MVLCTGISMYDIRTTIKAVTVEAVGLGESVYIANDGLAYVVDNGKSDVCHGWALEAAALGDTVTIITTCRMDVDTTQTIGARAYTGSVAGGSPPSTTLAAAGVVVGFAWQANRLFLQVPTPAADG